MRGQKICCKKVAATGRMVDIHLTTNNQVYAIYSSAGGYYGLSRGKES